jgi:transposase
MGSKKKKIFSNKELESINLNAAGIDVGSREYFVAIPEGRDKDSVKKFGAFTEDIKKLSSWLKKNKIATVAMESTGVYWIPLYEYLESEGFEVLLVNARHVKNVSGRKTDILDCQWIQQLHTYGLLRGAFRPDEEFCVLRSFLRHRKNLVHKMTREIHHMQKALTQMNIKLRNVLSEITSVTGLKIIKAIVQGERDLEKLAECRNNSCKSNRDEIKKSLEGNYRAEHLFSLSQALQAYEFYEKQISECDERIRCYLGTLINSDGQKSDQTSFQALLKQVVGVDLTKIEGISTTTALTLISEIALDMDKFPDEKHFASWLGLCPSNKISGGKILSNKTQNKSNRAAEALRISARSLHSSKSALGAFFRRIKIRRGAPKAITATAHKLARLVYHMLKNGEEYVSSQMETYEKNYKEQVLQNLQRKARAFGFDLTPHIQAA